MHCQHKPIFWALATLRRALRDTFIGHGELCSDVFFEGRRVGTIRLESYTSIGEPIYQIKSYPRGGVLPDYNRLLLFWEVEGIIESFNLKKSCFFCVQITNSDMAASKEKSLCYHAELHAFLQDYKVYMHELLSTGVGRPHVEILLKRDRLTGKLAISKVIQQFACQGEIQKPGPVFLTPNESVLTFPNSTIFWDEFIQAGSSDVICRFKNCSKVTSSKLKNRPKLLPQTDVDMK